jgi:PAS domain S-box-containing protein
VAGRTTALAREATVGDEAHENPDEALRGQEDWLVGGGELGELIRSADWTCTPLGPREAWPQSLRTAVNVVLANRFPMALLWGPELLLLYNDAYRLIAADKLPRALGRSTLEVWSEVWLANEPVITAVFDRGETVYLEDQLFPINRRGYVEDAYFTLSYGPVHLEDGTVGGALVTLQVTTLAVEQNRRHREHEAQSRAILDALVEGVVLLDTNGVGQHVNEAARNLLGPALGELMDPALAPRFRLTRADGTPFPADEQPAMMAIRTGQAVRDVEMGVAFEGGLRWLSVSAQPARNSQGKIVGAVASFFDVTDRKRTEVERGRLIAERKRADDALREREARLASIYAAVSDVIFLLAIEPDGGYRFESINQAFLEVTGLPAEAILGRRVEDVIPEPSLTLVRDRYRQAITTRMPVRWQETTSYPTGDLVGDVAVTPLSDPDGHVTHLVGAVHDITALKRREQELQDADRRRTEFLAVLSHELRNPLAAIRNSLYVLGRAAPGGEQARRAQTVIDRQVGHLTRLIDDLLDVTRIARGKIQLRREPLDFVDLAKRTVEDYASAFLKNDVHLEMVPGPAAVWVNGDRTRLAQVVGNLLQNAAKFSRRGGKTTVSVDIDASCAHPQAVLTVRDSGIGMPPEILPRLFEAFAQADTSLDRSKGGLGLGLAIVKGVIEMHDGSVAAASEGIGKGSVFTVRLPCDTTAIDAASPRHSVHDRASSSRRVLIIEDNVDAADTLREALELGGCIVAVAHDGPEGMERARALPLDVVLCDIGLPGMNGYAVARAMRSDPALKHVALVALTGYGQADDVAAAREAGFDAHLVKPPDIGALQSVLEEAIRLRQSSA